MLKKRLNGGLFGDGSARSGKCGRCLAGGSGDADLSLVSGAFGKVELGGNFLLIAEGAGIDGPGAVAFADEVDAHVVVAALDCEANTGEGIVFVRGPDQGGFALAFLHF